MSKKLLWPAGFSEAELSRADRVLSEVQTCRGMLRIADTRVSDAIEWLKFQVELCP